MKDAAEDDDDDNKNILKVALLQFQVTNDKAMNHATCATYIANAAQAGAQLLVLPEMWNCPYATIAFPDYAEPILSDSYDATTSSSSSSLSPSTDFLRRLAVQYNVWIVGGSIPEVVVEMDQTTKKYYNTCPIINPQGQMVAKHRKLHLFDVNVPGGIKFHESDVLTAGNAITHFNTPQWGNIGVGICYDIRFAEYSLALTRLPINCQILIYPGAFNMTTGPAHWELLQRARAVDGQCYVLTASPARQSEPSSSVPSKYPHYTAWGHSTVVSPWGEVLATRDETEGIVYADLDLPKVEQVRAAIPIGQQRRHDVYELVTYDATDSS
jgi:omega-amidase